MIPSPYEKSAVTLCVGSMKYAGFQVAYIVWAYIISILVCSIIATILAIVIIILKEGHTDWLLNKVLQTWPGILVTICVVVFQKLMAKYVFLQGNGEWLRLDNRRFFFIMTFFMFFYNIFLGLLSCLLRIVKAMVIGIVMLARLDNSTLPRKFEDLDPGFSAYQGFIHMEAAHTHPVVIVFIRLLAALKNERKRKENNSTNVDIEMKKLPNGSQEDVGKTDKPVNMAARFQWQVTYTLITNPRIRVYRKGYMQQLTLAKQQGLKIPMSDKPTTDFDLVKSQEEREKERQEEAERIKVVDGKKKGIHALITSRSADSTESLDKFDNNKNGGIGGKLKNVISRNKDGGGESDDNDANCNSGSDVSLENIEFSNSRHAVEEDENSKVAANNEEKISHL